MITKAPPEFFTFKNYSTTNLIGQVGIIDVFQYMTREAIARLTFYSPMSFRGTKVGSCAPSNSFLINSAVSSA